MKLKRQQPERRSPVRTAEVAVEVQDLERFRFDPDKHLLPEDFDRMKKNMDEFIRAGKIQLFLNEARAILLLFPERRNELELDYLIESVYNEIDDIEKQNRLYAVCLRLALYIAQVFPEHKVSQERCDGWLEKCKELYKNPQGVAYLEAASYYLQMFPNQKEKLELDQGLYDELIDDTRFLRTDAVTRWAQSAERLLVLFPEHRGDLDVNDDLLLGLYESIEQGRGADSKLWFANMLRSFAIFSADEIKLNGGIYELVYNNEIGREQKLPDRKLA